jgi:nitroreductase
VDGRDSAVSLGYPNAQLNVRSICNTGQLSNTHPQFTFAVALSGRQPSGSWLDLGMFVQNVMLAAAGRGLQSCPQETFAKYHRILRPLLFVPNEQMVVCGKERDDARIYAAGGR